MMIVLKLLKVHRRLFANQRSIKLNKFLYHASLRGMGIDNWESDEVSGELHLVQKILPALLPDNPVVVWDVGANDGKYVRLISEEFPLSIIYAFEPHPKTCARLAASVRHANIKVFQLALGDSMGEVSLFDRAGSNGSVFASLARDAITVDRSDLEIEEHRVAISTIDEFAKAHEVDRIHFLKIDTEGQEFACLRGAEALLKRRAIDVLLFEFNRQNIVSRVFCRDFRELLSGYELFRLLPKGLMPLPQSGPEAEIFGFQNILAVKAGSKIS